MGQVIVNMNLTLDGVMQAPRRRNEDRRDGFRHGGWALPYVDPRMEQQATGNRGQTPALLLGRRTFEDLRAEWHGRKSSPVTRWLAATRKYVVSTTLRDTRWMNTVVIAGDVPERIRGLKARNEDLLILGSGELVQSLIPHDLIDVYALAIHPIVLGAGRRLFRDGGPPTSCDLVEVSSTSTGVVMMSYARRTAVQRATTRVAPTCSGDTSTW